MPDLNQVIAAIPAIACGQFLSLILSGTNIFYSLANDHGIYPAIFPNEIVYHIILVLSLCRPRTLYRSWKKRAPIPAYVALGVVDLGANIAVLMSFEYTSAISVMIITSTSAIFAMAMSMVAFRRRYTRVHMLGTAIVVVGLVLINYHKYLVQDPDEKSFYWLGTFLAFVGAIGYALSNVINEYVSRWEPGYPIASLAAMGFFASIASSIACHATAFGRNDRDTIMHAPLPAQRLLLGFVTCMVALYILLPLYVQKFSAVMLNFNLLTADLVILLFNHAFRSAVLTVPYLLGFFCVFAGMVVFNLVQPIDAPQRASLALERSDSVRLTEKPLNLDACK
ncbi:unnamed protein product (mitochondrion) [Plasmodiophora brassicae]|uniref:EamA domain-containing protein n=1 Tax=Plasmodiophora brassicae TaxID=37360 RepID=A0A0G4IWG9_PLABS|nr:hypothetical protein PBRA_007358 [Plasmodiophora brassicae]SPQ98038.1 unnamed protein product [Plasmodiophora brassicae]